MGDKKPHHHGNLRASLVEAGIDLVREGGPDALSIRKVAAAAGVSHAAPAHHFHSLAHLRTAVSTEGFRRFADSMLAEMSKSAPDPRSQLVAACRGYLGFARTYPGLFDLMFGCQPNVVEDTAYWLASYDAYQVLSRISEPYGRKDPGGRRMAEMRIWSFIHGLAGLCAGNNVMFSASDEIDSMLEALVPDFGLPTEP